MFWSKEARLKKMEQQIAGKKARLAAAMRIGEWAKALPIKIVYQLLDLPQEIAELEKRAEQLSASNAGVQAAAQPVACNGMVDDGGYDSGF